MIVRRYLDPITEINAIRRQINDAFGDFATEALAKADWTPAVRLVDQGNEFMLTIYLAGVSAADLDVQVSADVVSISGTRNRPEATDSAKVLYDDTRYGSFHRLVNLPDGVQNDQVVANFAHGVLTLTLPKVVEARNKVVKIDLSSTETPAIEAG
ncbi:Hsp20/alpha crystallin family protein [Nodosilinea sp. LEGE 07298]|uniref:Hsp20/alpha crystallin family protein n=1 Tax=Nodosilinea sp. LEGE 07298 TaxID=2777970 RepID=UPI001881E30A|nr:Hsp20/alpha crystallin family protein [Nodosilinea sp. LEGE 07298]MBE9112848.1 Hsp20/alpha crystallin family protein [Nodosilinea sp. LEGE 07298]